MSRKPPAITTHSPAERPLRISISAALRAPVSTGRRTNVAGPGPDEDDRPGLEFLEGGGGNDKGRPFRPGGRSPLRHTCPRRSWPSAFPTSTRPSTVRVFSSMTAPTRTSRPENSRSGVGLGPEDGGRTGADRGQVLFEDVDAGPQARRVGQLEKGIAQVDMGSGEGRGFDDRPGKGRPDRKKRPRLSRRDQGVDVLLVQAQGKELPAGRLKKGGRRGFLGIAPKARRPGGGLKDLRLRGQKLPAVDFGQHLAGGDPIAGDGRDPFDPAVRPGRDFGQAPGVEIELARGGNPVRTERPFSPWATAIPPSACGFGRKHHRSGREGRLIFRSAVRTPRGVSAGRQAGKIAGREDDHQDPSRIFVFMFILRVLEFLARRFHFGQGDGIEVKGV